jgi:hypothetical protein
MKIKTGIQTYNVYNRRHGFVNQRGQTFHEANPRAEWDETVNDFFGTYVFGIGQWTDIAAAQRVAERVNGTVVAGDKTTEITL